jgi:hypothetical protein
LEAAAAIARLGMLRLMRQNTVRWSLPLALLPVALATTSVGFDAALKAQLVLIAVLAPLILARGTAEEVEEKTLAYLWSRPLPRWTLPAGKLAAGIPLLAALVCGPGALSFLLGRAEPAAHLTELFALLLGLALGAVAAGVAALATGSLWPRQPLSGALIYLLALDLALREMPFWLHNLSLTHQVEKLATAGMDVGAALWLIGLTAFWGAVAIWRVYRL